MPLPKERQAHINDSGSATPARPQRSAPPEGEAGERGTDERECTTDVHEVLGKTTWTINDLDYVWEPQAAAGSPTNKAYEMLAPGTTGFLTFQWGIDVEADLVAGSKVWQFPVTVGEQVPKTPEGGAAEKIKIVQLVVVTGPILKDQVLVI